MSTSPPSGRSSNPATCSNVDLPAPDGPTSATISPGRKARSTPFSTLSSVPASRKTRRTSRNSSAAPAGIPGSLVAQGFDRVEPGGAPGRVESGEEGEGERHNHDSGDLAGVDARRNAGEEIDLGGKQIGADDSLKYLPDRFDVV